MRHDGEVLKRKISGVEFVKRGARRMQGVVVIKMGEIVRPCHGWHSRHDYLFVVAVLFCFVLFYFILLRLTRLTGSRMIILLYCTDEYVAWKVGGTAKKKKKGCV